MTPEDEKEIREWVEKSTQLMNDKIARWSIDRGEIHNLADMGLEHIETLLGEIERLRALPLGKRIARVVRPPSASPPRQSEPLGVA